MGNKQSINASKHYNQTPRGKQVFIPKKNFAERSLFSLPSSQIWNHDLREGEYKWQEKRRVSTKYYRHTNNKVSESVFAHIKSWDLKTWTITLNMPFAAFIGCTVFIAMHLIHPNSLRTPRVQRQSLIHLNSPAPGLVSNNIYCWIISFCWINGWRKIGNVWKRCGSDQ